METWGFSAGINSAGKWDVVKNGGAQPNDPYSAFLHREGLMEEYLADMRHRAAKGTYAYTDPTPLPDEAYSDTWTAGNAIKLLEGAAPRDVPWHMQVNFSGPHDPVDVTRSMHSLYRQPPVNFPGPIDPEAVKFNHQETRRNYAAMIENIDRQCGRILDTVTARGELENTIVVFTADHGESLGDHSFWKKHRPNRASASIPLVIAGPGIRPADCSDVLVSLIDCGATFLDYAGVQPSAAMTARSLRPVLEGKSTRHRDYLTSGLGPWRMLETASHKLTAGFTPTLGINQIMVPAGAARQTSHTGHAV